MYIDRRVNQVAGGLGEEKNRLLQKKKIVCLLFIDDSCLRASTGRSERSAQFMGFQLLCICVCKSWLTAESGD